MGFFFTVLLGSLTFCRAGTSVGKVKVTADTQSRIKTTSLLMSKWAHYIRSVLSMGPELPVVGSLGISDQQSAISNL